VSRPRWIWWVVLAVAAVLLAWGWYVLGYLDEPSAVARVRVALLVIGIGSLALGIAAGGSGIWMLVARRT